MDNSWDPFLVPMHHLFFGQCVLFLKVMKIIITVI